MKRFLTYSLIAGACSFAFATGALAQTTDETDGTDVTVEAPAFVDADGDGINDIAAMRHQMRKNGIAGAYRHESRAMMTDVRGQLTEEQIAELDLLLADLRAGETSREDLHAAVTVKLQEFGVEIPENWGQTPGQFGRQLQLTEEQRSELHTLVEGMRGEDASREDIHAAVEAMHAEWGIEAPTAAGSGQRGQRGQRGSRRN